MITKRAYKNFLSYIYHILPISQSFAEIRIIKQLIDNSERGTMNSEFNIYSTKKREYLYDLNEADFR